MLPPTRHLHAWLPALLPCCLPALAASLPCTHMVLSFSPPLPRAAGHLQNLDELVDRHSGETFGEGPTSPSSVLAGRGDPRQLAAETLLHMYIKERQAGGDLLLLLSELQVRVQIASLWAARAAEWIGGCWPCGGGCSAHQKLLWSVQTHSCRPGLRSLLPPLCIRSASQLRLLWVLSLHAGPVLVCAV